MATKKILIPLDESPDSRQIFRTIQQFFRPDDCQIELLQVIDPMLEDVEIPPAHAALEWTPAMYTYLQKLQTLEQDAQHHHQDEMFNDLKTGLLEEAEALTQAGYTVTPAVRNGAPIAEIEAFIQSHNIDLVAMVTHAREGIGRLLFGSVSGKLVHDLPIPVLLLHPQKSA